MVSKLKTIFKSLDLDLIKSELDRALEEVYRTNFDQLEDEIAYRTNMSGLMQPYIISSIEDKLNSTILVMEDSTEQLKSIKNKEGFTDFLTFNCDIIQRKINQLQEFYRYKTNSEIEHRFKEYVHTTAKGKTVNIKIEACTKEQQVKTRSSIQRKILKIVTNLELILQENDKKNLMRGADIPERMEHKTQSRK